jgi:hypothetical protein
MSVPELQAVTVIFVDGPFEDVASRVEGVQVDLGVGGGIGGDELIDRALAIVAPRYYVFEEHRSQTNWGATGLQTQDIEILFAVGVGVELTAAAIIASLKGLTRTVAGRRRVEDAGAASAVFQGFLAKSFKVTSSVRVESINERGEVWTLVAKAGSHVFAGDVTKDGRVIQAKRIS